MFGVKFILIYVVYYCCVEVVVVGVGKEYFFCFCLKMGFIVFMIFVYVGIVKYDVYCQFVSG